MAVVKGAKRKPWTARAAKATKKNVAIAGQYVSDKTTKRLCTHCNPPLMVPIRDLDVHNGNFHKPGGYEYELRKLRAAQSKETAKAPPTPVRPPRPRNATKSQPAAAQEPPAPKQEKPVSVAPTGAPSQNGRASGTAPELIAESFRTWARQVPPSIPAARADAQAMADSYRQMADAIRMRVQMEMESNNLPQQVIEPYHQAATLISQLGDLHMEVVRRIDVRYKEIANILARPDTPNAE
jgi:hypothetical protein